MVRRGLPAHLVLQLPLPRPRLHLLLAEIRLHLAHRPLRNRLRGLWGCAELGRFHRWTRDPRRGCRGDDERRHDPHDQCPSAGEEAGLDGSCGGHGWGCECGWAVAGWGADDEC